MWLFQKYSLQLLAVAFLYFFRCDNCTRFINKKDPSEEEVKEYTAHVLRKNEAYNACHADCQDNSKVVSFDLEKILQFPRLETKKQTFYKSLQLQARVLYLLVWARREAWEQWGGILLKSLCHQTPVRKEAYHLLQWRLSGPKQEQCGSDSSLPHGPQPPWRTVNDYDNPTMCCLTMFICLFDDFLCFCWCSINTTINKLHPINHQT